MNAKPTPIRITPRRRIGLFADSAVTRLAISGSSVVPDASMASDARAVMCDQLKAVGVTEVTMLSQPVQASDAVESGPRVVAA